MLTTTITITNDQAHFEDGTCYNATVDQIKAAALRNWQMQKHPSDLKHTHAVSSSLASIWLLDNGAVIDAEAQAMLQALYSRSLAGFESNMDAVARRGADNFMSKYYIGYGHKSIGDLGSVTLFIEGVSMLAAKAIQNFPLYDGQEGSTRYIDYTWQPFYDPNKTEMSQAWLERCRKFYVDGSAELINSYLPKQYPFEEGMDSKVWGQALIARACDIMRGFLPCGTTTKLAWTGKLRSIREHTTRLLAHPLGEVRSVGEAIWAVMHTRYPSSFEAGPPLKLVEYLMREMSVQDHLDEVGKPPLLVTGSLSEEEVEFRGLRERPAGYPMPASWRNTCMASAEFDLDFASWRDLQRHRVASINVPMPELTGGIASWYYESLSPSLQREFVVDVQPMGYALNADLEKQMPNMAVRRLLGQYYALMGAVSRHVMHTDLPGLVYILELRSRPTVHPTLRTVTHELADIFEAKHGAGLIHVDRTPDAFQYRRGKQTITAKEES